MEENITIIKNWLGTGSINIFGLPLSGKDTVGIRLAETLSAKLLSSGLIIREMAKQKTDGYSENHYATGILTPIDLFQKWVLPYFGRPDLAEYPLILSSVGRWFGEELAVLDAAENANHPIKAVLLLNISEQDVRNRWDAAKLIGDRKDRLDDSKPEIFETRLREFRIKTMPVIQTYRNLGLLVSVNADQSKEEVFKEVVQKLAEFAVSQESPSS